MSEAELVEAGRRMTARELALRVVRDVFPPPESRAPERTAQASFDYHVRRSQLSERDRAFATELAYGAIKMRRTLEWYLEGFIARDIPSIIREILRLAVYELVYTRADEHATVFESVNLAKRYTHRGLANLVNAVLRSFLRERPVEPQRTAFETDDDFIATRYSLPTWLVRQWRAVFAEELERICAAVNDPPRSAVVVNSLKATPEDVASQLSDAGVETRRSAIVPEVLLTERGLGSFPNNDGAWWMQSESSAMPVDVLGPQPDEAILDACSGRGNKALQIGARLAGQGSLLCVERDARKTSTLSRRLEQADIVAAIVTGDATSDALLGDRRFDRVLIDAPCSGVGVVGRHPEARWKKQGTDGERLAPTQRALLEAMARHVYPGGALVYAVCSTDPRETVDVIDGFLARENFERGLIPAAYEALLTEDGDVLVPPGIDGRDGFFIARIERRS
jgi:16S rRNA (cytosine967-C5)-methyltransferase